jgi:hypothetical protein
MTPELQILIASSAGRGVLELHDRAGRRPPSPADRSARVGGFEPEHDHVVIRPRARSRSSVSGVRNGVSA